MTRLSLVLVARLLLLSLAACFPMLVTAAEPYREDVIKAAFLYRFTGYMEWPAEALKGDSFTIAVIGGNSVADELNKLNAQHAIKNLPIRVRSIDAARQAIDVQILYVGPQYTGNVQQLTESLATLPILIVTDLPSGLDDGGTVNFMIVDRRVRFEVSLAAAQRAGIKVSSELLAVAARVRGSSLLSDPGCVPALKSFDSFSSCIERVAAAL